MRQPPELLLDAVEEPLDPVQARRRLRRQLARQLVERQIDRGEELPRLVVQLVRDAPGLVLEEVVQPAERRVRLPHPAVGHLERRQALEEEILRGLDGPQAVTGRARAGVEQRPVDEPGHVQHAQTRAERRPSQLIGGEQPGLLAS